jgi:uncharacterized protein YkwD
VGPDDVLGLLGCGYAPTALTDGGHCPAPLKDVRPTADNHVVERPRPDGPNARARAYSMLGVALASLVAATSATGAAAAKRSAVRAADTAIIVQMNAIRAHAGLRPLQVNSELAAAAREHSLEMTDIGYFSHASADGGSMADRVRASYPAGRRWRVGETLLRRSPEIGSRRAVGLWMASPEHRAIILTPAWRDVGCAFAHAPAAPGVYDGLAVTVVTCDFGVRS